MKELKNVTVVKKANIYYDGMLQAVPFFSRTAQKKHSALSCPENTASEQQTKNKWKYWRASQMCFCPEVIHGNRLKPGKCLKCPQTVNSRFP